MKVYVAGSSKEIERAEGWIKQLRSNGITVTSTWPEVIRSVGANNPRDRTREEYCEWVDKDFGEIEAAEVFWLLLPTTPTVGAWIELGHANARGKLIVASGEHKPIFTPALASIYSLNDVGICHRLDAIKNFSVQQLLELR